MPQLSFPSYLTEGAPAAGSSQVALVVENPPANAGGIGDLGLIPGPGRSPGGGHGNPLQYSCLENPMHRGAWQATYMYKKKYSVHDSVIVEYLFGKDSTI